MKVQYPKFVDRNMRYFGYYDKLNKRFWYCEVTKNILSLSQK